VMSVMNCDEGLRVQLRGCSFHDSRDRWITARLVTIRQTDVIGDLMGISINTLLVKHERSRPDNPTRIRRYRSKMRI
jgi:hypothetical protein